MTAKAALLSGVSYSQRPPGYSRMTEADKTILKQMHQKRRLYDEGKAMFRYDELVNQPVDATPFLLAGTLPVLGLLPNTTYTLIRQTVPEGFRGVLTSRSFWVSGSSFVDGSGVLTWGIATGDGWLYDHGNLTFSIPPDFTGGLIGRGGQLVLPDQVLSLIVRTGPDVSPLALDAVINARLKGWYAPS